MIFRIYAVFRGSHTPMRIAFDINYEPLPHVPPVTMSPSELCTWSEQFDSFGYYWIRRRE